MNKMSKCSMLTLAVLMSACQTIPSVAVADNASAAAEVKTADPAPVPAPAPATVAEPKASAPAAAPVAASKEEPVSMITPMTERNATIRATGYAVISTQN
ncbi:MAG: hypothetical protein ACKOA0_04975, partial [Burkholderiaceae bacterium]